jgi:hypothetical protein
MLAFIACFQKKTQKRNCEILLIIISEYEHYEIGSIQIFKGCETGPREWSLSDVNIHFNGKAELYGKQARKVDRNRDVEFRPSWSFHSLYNRFPNRPNQGC